jgi:hypothetical protein
MLHLIPIFILPRPFSKRGLKKKKKTIFAIMRRVSSRQRINSWGSYVESSVSSEESVYEAFPPDLESPSSTGDRTYLRKRNRLYRPSKSVGSGTANDQSSLSSVCNDVKLAIVSFLPVNDARSLMSTSHENNDLVREADFLWESWCLQRWPHLPQGVKFQAHDMHYSNLLNLAAADSPPTHIHSSTFTASFSTVRNAAVPIFAKVDNSPTTIQYLGAVGTGDRCIRANAPLAHPCCKDLNHPGLLQFLLPKRPSSPQPFVSPYCCGPNVVKLTPRHVSYFEVTIAKEQPEIPAGAPEQTLVRDGASDCIAIGLSTKAFRCYSRMPGWDACSYGYHGDDGGIFHASGDMLKRFGPSFGKGDTVGCGVDFKQGGIFFTLNGELLGYGWNGLNFPAISELYPTIGVDSNYPVDCNFGQRKYMFDFDNFVETYEERTVESSSS